MKQEIVITGIGVVTPMDNGEGVDKFWKGLCSSQNMIRPITRFSTNGFECHVGGEVSGFDNNEQDRAFQFFNCAVSRAIKDAEILKPVDDIIGVSFGTILGNIEVGQEYMNKVFFQNNPRNPDIFNNYSLHAIPALIAKKYKLTGPNICVGTACSSSSDSIGMAVNEIKNKRADIMIAGGADVLSEFIFRGFSALAALTKDGKVRPFDKNRTGLAISEGAGVIVLETKEHAIKRGAKIYAEIIGFGSINDAYHIIKPHKDGLGLSLAIDMAIKDAGIKPEDIDYINAHGTGTVYNDLAESKAIKLSFKDKAEKIKISSIKSMIGHSMGASSVIEVICCVKTIEQGLIPPTINFSQKDPNCCDMDYVVNKARESQVNIAMSLSAGFGGQNSVIILKK